LAVGLFARNLIEVFALVFSVLVLGRVLMSWVDNGRRNQLSSFLFSATEPILGPIRRMLPQTGMLDLSPMIVLIVLSFVLQALR
jgi:YggT family protein